ncbi:FMN reductase [Bacteroidia bacterium]|nr:FMN reductase [Bacteroidia bacterium]
MNSTSDTSKKISRRTAIKRVGFTVAGLAAATAGIRYASSKKEIIKSSNDTFSHKNFTKMKVLLINGSPHKNGCTHTALTEVAAALQKNGVDTELLWLDLQPISGCRGCGSCRATGKCIVDDVVNQVIARADQYDGLIVGSPVHYAGASGFVTSFMDRLFYAGSRRFVGKPGAAIVSCRRAGSTAALEQLNKYFTINNMPLVSSQYWNMVHGNTPDEVRQDLEGMQTMRTLGQNMAWLLQCIAAGKAAGIALPTYENRVGTNFIR